MNNITIELNPILIKSTLELKRYFLDAKFVLRYSICICLSFIVSMGYSQPPNTCIESCASGATYYGFNAGASTTSGSNCFFGTNSGIFNISGTRNSFFGKHSGINNNFGKDNCFFGDEAGANNTTGEKNVYVGQAAGTNLHTGIRNICIGFRSGPALGSESASDRLFIDVVKSDTPLIYGEFDNDHVTINGTFEVTAGISNPSSRKLKKNFEQINTAEILDKIANLSIEKWVYKHRDDELHIGPIAEEFYETFGLGASSEQISTIDSDGIALAAIQALKSENDELRQLISALQAQVEDIQNN